MTPEKAGAKFLADFLALAIGIFAGAGMTRLIERYTGGGLRQGAVSRTVGLPVA